MEYDNNVVSVIIPAYNAEKYIGQTLESVLAQDYDELEILVIDDCSKDGTLELVKKYSERYPQIKIIELALNSGVAVARNTAIERATGRYIAFMDSDDLWESNKISSQIKLMRDNDATMAFTAIDMIDDDGNCVKGKRKIKTVVDYKILLHNTVIPTSSVVIDREKSGDFRMPLLRSGQDYATWLMLLRNGVKAYGIDEALVHYRVGHKSLSSNKLKSIKQVYTIQTQQEKICKISAAYNTLCFAINALKKYLF